MAGTSLLALLDDIATVLDDISILTKVAAKKTAGVLGDDLALNAQQVAGVQADRELPVVWAVAKGSFKNKLILVPAAIAISALAPWAIVPLLMLGGAYLCFEGFEKLAHKFLHSKVDDKTAHAEMIEALSRSAIDLVTYEKEKIKGAIRTDFILSAEIIVIALGTVKDAALGTQIAVVSGIAVVMTAGVYGLVAGIVKLDDAGLYLARSAEAGSSAWNRVKRVLGNGLLGAAPHLMKTLSVVGTIAMFLVGGGILVHGIPHAHEVLEHAAEAVHAVPGIGALFAVITPTLLNTLAGVLAGAVVLVVVSVAKAVFGKRV
jgi:hypothetical protein